MKMVIKLVYMCIIGMVTVFLFYPFLHEFCHLIAAVSVGADIFEFSVFPLPYVSCVLEKHDIYKQTLIGASALVLPTAIYFIRLNSFTGWFLTFFLKIIVALSWLFSFYAVLCYILGDIWRNEDIIKVVSLNPESKVFWLVVCLLAMIWCFHAIAREKPLSKILSFF